MLNGLTLGGNQVSKRGYLFVIAAATLWGTTGTTQALAPAGGSPLVIGTLRLVAGGAALAIIAAARGQLPPLKTWPIKACLLASVFIAAYQLFFFAGVSRTGVAVGTIVGIGSSPILAGMLAFFVTHERPNKGWYVATFLAIAGCSLLASAGKDIRVDPLGLFLAIMAGASYAAFTIASKKILAWQAPETAMAVIFSMGAVILSPLMLLTDIRWLARPGTWLVILHLGLITVALAYRLFAAGLKQVTASTAVTLTLAEPMTAGLLGVLVLKEPMTPLARAGILLIFSGLLFLSLWKESEENSH